MCFLFRMLIVVAERRLITLL